MTLLELCEPVFQYVCRLRRSARLGRALEMAQVRNDIKTILQKTRAQASTVAELVGQYDKIELPLIFFVDFMIKESNLNFAAEWSELGREKNELAGDEKFFDLLDADLADQSDAATHRLAVFYTCLGLGFTGIYTGQPKEIQRLMLRISARISGMMDADERSYICPEAYDNVDSRDFVQPSSTKLGAIGIFVIGLIIVWAIAYCWLFQSASEGVKESLENIKDYETRSSQPLDQ